MFIALRAYLHQAKVGTKVKIIKEQAQNHISAGGGLPLHADPPPYRLPCMQTPSMRTPMHADPFYADSPPFR